MTACGWACSDGRTAHDANARYGCATAADCLEGFACVCGLCSSAGSPPICADAAPADSAPGTDAAPLVDSVDVPDAPKPGDTQPMDAAAADLDAGPTLHTGACNLADWKPCVGARGCYYAVSTKVTFCAKHGGVSEGAPCDPDPAAAPVCGRAIDSTPLVCDTQDKKCYRTCTCKPVSATACPQGLQCYCLTATSRVSFPNDAGICAP
ncbi:MAG: hypothetical protein EXR79_08980 [Myxococcales bacterium]|nr:hypothetical protein [Myxococcales bacterium]